MKLHEFADDAAARLHEETTYINITANEAEQFFGVGGLVPNLTDAMVNKSDAQIPENVVEVMQGMPTTIGDIAHTLLNTMGKSNGLFGINPQKTSGILNRAAGQHLVAAGVVTEPQMEAFYAIGTTVVKPYENIADGAVQAAKDELTAQGTTSVGVIMYNGHEAQQDNDKSHFVSPNFRKYQFGIKLKDKIPTPFDTKVTIVLEERDGFGDWVESKTVTVNVKAGVLPPLYPVIGKIARHTRVGSASIGLANTPFDLEVSGG